MLFNVAGQTETGLKLIATSLTYLRYRAIQSKLLDQN